MINIKTLIPVFVMGAVACFAAFSQKASVIIFTPWFEGMHIPLPELRVYIFTITILCLYLCYMGGYITGNQIAKAKK